MASVTQDVSVSRKDLAVDLGTAEEADLTEQMEHTLRLMLSAPEQKSR